MSLHDHGPSLEFFGRDIQSVVQSQEMFLWPDQLEVGLEFLQNIPQSLDPGGIIFFGVVLDFMGECFDADLSALMLLD